MVERVLALTTRYSAAASFCFSALALAAPTMLMRLFTPDEALISSGAQYLRVVSPSYLLSGISQIDLCIMKNSGRVAKSSLYATVPVLLNLALNALLIYGLLGLPGLGIVGAAMATVLSRMVEFLLVVIEQGRKNVVRLRIGFIVRRQRGLAREYWRYTRPVMANELAWGGGVTMYSVIMGYLGSDAVAANAVASIVRNMVGCAASGFGTGSGILLGHLLGAGQLEQAKRDGGRMVRYAVMIGAISGLVIFCLSPLMLRLSGTLTDTAHAYLQAMLWMCSLYMIGKALNMTLVVGVFCAGGDTKFGFWCDLISIWGVILPLGLAAAFWFHAAVPVVYAILSQDEFLKIPAEVRHYMQYKWLNNITEEAEA